MDNNQISSIVETAVGNLSKVAEVNTIIGNPIVTMDGKTIMPISQISFAFMAGGGEYGDKNVSKNLLKEGLSGHFAGGSGGGASLNPVGFLVIDKDGVSVVNVPEEGNMGKVLDIVKDVLKNVKKD